MYQANLFRLLDHMVLTLPKWSSTIGHMPATHTYIKQLMEAHGHNPSSLATATGLSRMTLERRIRNPHTFALWELDLIAPELGTTLTDLVTGDAA